MCFNSFIINSQELTGTLPSDYPLMPDEKPPQIRRRIGASFKLDEGLIHLDKQVQVTTQIVFSVWGNEQKRLPIQNLCLSQDSELQALETDLALQLQIYEAARKLSLEENLSKPQKKSRLQQCKREEKKVKNLQEAVLQQRIKSECNSPCISITNSQNKGQWLCCCLQAKLWAALMIKVGLMNASKMFVLCVQICACLMIAPCLMWWLWMMVSKYSIGLWSLFTPESCGVACNQWSNKYSLLKTLDIDEEQITLYDKSILK